MSNFDDIDELFQQALDEAGITDAEIMQLAMMIDEALAKGLPESMGFPDWTYKDLPRMLPSVKDEFIALVGEDNIKWITFANYDDGSVRGQVLLSPTAMAIVEKTATSPSMN